MSQKPQQSEDDALRSIHEQIDAARATGKFTVAVFSYDEKAKNLNVARTSWQFPTDQFDAAIKMLQAQFDEETKGPQLPDKGPLPFASFAKDAPEGPKGPA